jgi:ferredoxin-NADP reductase
MLAEVGPRPAEQPRFYTCAPTPFIEAVAEAFVRLGHESPGNRCGNPRFVLTTMTDTNSVTTTATLRKPFTSLPSCRTPAHRAGSRSSPGRCDRHALGTAVWRVAALG